MKGEPHRPVLLAETMNFLITRRNGIYVDATLGAGGHTAELLHQLGPDAHCIGIDADESACTISRQRLGEENRRVTVLQGFFDDLTALLESVNVSTINGVLFDLGVSSMQIDEDARGFSFRSDERLDMRMDRRQRQSAYEVVNEYDVEELARTIYEYGEERHSRRIARKIVEERSRSPIATTGQLADIVHRCVAGKFAVKSLARVFQALRIEVNRELERLSKALEAAVGHLQPGGRVVVISYHSLEDRIVKNFFRDSAAATDERQASLFILTKKPITPARPELATNPRSRSAKLRAAEKRGATL